MVQIAFSGTLFVESVVTVFLIVILMLFCGDISERSHVCFLFLANKALVP